MKTDTFTDGIRICDFSQVAPQTATTREFAHGKWQLIDYNTTGGAGTMLTARYGLELPELKLQLNLKGWYKLSVCLSCDSWTARPGISLMLSGDKGASFMTKPGPQPGEYTWRPDEKACEFFWECADMTGQELIIKRLHDGIKSTLSLLWIRAVPMTEEEVTEYKQELARRDTKRLHVHTDLDWMGLVDNAAADDIFAPFIHDLVKSDAEIVSVEFYPLLSDHSWLEKYSNTEEQNYLDPRLYRHREYVSNSSRILTKLNLLSHEAGLKMYAALRIALSNCPPPEDISTLRSTLFTNEHKEYFCVDRDGEVITTVSLAYPEVREYLAGEFVKVLDYGFDGISVFTHRGVLTLFEEPVIRRFAEYYPGIDPRLLPMRDERLQQVHCSFITEFFQLLRRRLDEYSATHNCPRKAINVFSGFSCAADKCLGIDVESLAADSLIDSFIPSNMITWEEDSLFLDPDHPEMISLAKYKEVKYRAINAPVSRFFGDDLERVLENLPHHLEICRNSGVKCYIEMPWECTRTTEFLYDYAAKLFAAGAENISLWDSFHTRVMNRDEWNLVSRMGHRETFADVPSKRKDYVTLHRVLSLNNISTASYNPKWRG